MPVGLASETKLQPYQVCWDLKLLYRQAQQSTYRGGKRDNYCPSRLIDRHRAGDRRLWHSNTAQPCCAMIQTKAAKDRAPTYPLDRGLG